jgi:hypothetical protein
MNCLLLLHKFTINNSDHGPETPAHNSEWNILFHPNLDLIFMNSKDWLEKT